jgi:hypothetical protein
VNSEEVKLLAKQAAQLSQQAVELNKQGKRLEGYALMQQAVEAARESTKNQKSSDSVGAKGNLTIG